MKRTILAIATALFVGSASAGLWCKNDEGQTYHWQRDWPRPVESANFKMPSLPIFSTKGDVVCFLDGQLYRDVANNAIGIRGVPVQAAIPQDLVNHPLYGNQTAGTVYRGDMARWLIDNLPSSYGQYATFEYYLSINP